MIFAELFKQLPLADTSGMQGNDVMCLTSNETLLAELLRENKRMLDKAIRELDRERMALQNQEKKVIAEIKKTAKQGQMVRKACKLARVSSFQLLLN